MTLSAASLRWYDSDDMQQWLVNLTPSTIFILLYCITVAYFVCFILINLYKKHNNRIAYMAASIFAGTHILTESIKCAENPWVALPIIVILIVFGVHIHEKWLNERKENEEYYHLLEQKQLALHEELCKIGYDLVDNVDAVNTLQSKLFEHETYKTRTGLPIVDCLLEEKETTCKSENIDLHEVWCELSSSQVTNYDWVSLLSTLLNNAIDACRQCPNEKHISYSMERRDNFFILHISNTKASITKSLNNDLLTTKRYITNHGTGTQLIRDITLKYNGSIQYHDIQNESNVYITLDAWK